MKIAALFGLFLLVVGFFYYLRLRTPLNSIQSISAPTADLAKAYKAIEIFSNGSASGIRYIGENDDPVWGGVVYDFNDESGADFKVDKATSRVIVFRSIGGKGKIGSSTKSVSDIQAEKIGMAFAKKNMIEYETFTKSAEYSFLRESAPEMDGNYYLDWRGRTPITFSEAMHSYYGQQDIPPKFHSALTLDKFGNVISFLNEYITEDLGR